MPRSIVFQSLWKMGHFTMSSHQIEKQSEFMFFYKSEEIDNNQRINLNVTNKLVSEILNEITRIITWLIRLQANILS